MLKSLAAKAFIATVLFLFLIESAAGSSLGLPRNSASLLHQGPVRVTQADVDAYLSRIPADQRAGFLMSNERLGQALESLLLVRLLGNKAIEAGALEDALVEGSLYQGAMVYLAEHYRERYLEEQMLADYGQQARELYLTEPQLFRRPESVSFTHILVNRGRGRGELEAMEQIFELYEKLQAGEEFDALVSEYSDDPYADENQGSYENVAFEELDEEVANALQLMQPGQTSEPVLSAHGWHIIRLDGQTEAGQLPWENAESAAREIARQRHSRELIELLYRRLLDEHPVEIEPGSIEKLHERYGISGNDLPTAESLRQSDEG